jgi:hypothetical protein
MASIKGDCESGVSPAGFWSASLGGLNSEYSVVPVSASGLVWASGVSAGATTSDGSAWLLVPAGFLRGRLPVLRPRLRGAVVLSGAALADVESVSVID